MRPQQNFVSLRVPRNLRSVWPYPNLLHFEKFVDLLLLSASNEKVAYNKTVVIVPVGHVLLKYAFFASRWKMAYNTARSIFNVLAVAGWLKIQRMDCRTISNRTVKAPFLAFPKVGYENNGIIIYETKMADKKASVMAAVSLNDTDSYEDFSQRLGDGDDDGDGVSGDDSVDDGIDDGIDVGSDDGGDVGSDDGGDVGSVLITSSQSVDYEDIPQQPGHSSGSGTDHSEGSGEGRLIIYKEEEEEYIKKKNKKEKSPNLEDLMQFAEANGIVNFDVSGFWEYYEAEGWRDARGRQIKNWKRILMHAYKDEKSKFHVRTAPNRSSPPTAADKLARQNANLARNLAVHVADS